MSKYMEGPHAKEALKLIKLVVSRSSSLTAAPSLNSNFHSMNFASSFFASNSVDCISIASGTSFAESEFGVKRELPGRTMDFTFDLEQTPLIGFTYFLSEVNEGEAPHRDDRDLSASPKKSLSHHPSFNDSSGSNWRRPWFSQARTRERLVSLLTSFGQRVGLPKSPSVIFSQASDGAADRQSSLASSTEDVSAANNEVSTESKGAEEGTPSEFALFKDFDFLEYELESQDSEGMDNFNWGVRRRSLSNLDANMDMDCFPGSLLHQGSPRLREVDVSSDEEVSSVSPFDASNDLLLESGSHQENNAALDRPSSALSETGTSTPSHTSDGDACEYDLTRSNTSITSLSTSPK